MTQQKLHRFLLDSFPRGFSLFLAAFTLLNLAGKTLLPNFDSNLWWIDLRAFPSPVADGFLFAAAVALLAYAFFPPRAGWRRVLTISLAALLAAKSFADAIVFFRLLARHSLSTLIPVPLSLLICGVLILVIVSLFRSERTDTRVLRNHRCFDHQSIHSPQPVPSHPSSWRTFAAIAAIFVACAFAFPLAQIFCFGKTDYRRPADVAVVFGARVYADGRPSDALADRVRTACRLYREGTVKRLLFSGGPGDGRIHETETMRRIAIASGVKPEDILVDQSGLNTQATVNNSRPLLAGLHASRILVVSHFYHLPRIKLTYQRAGWEVYTVPAKESYLLRQLPYNIAREVAALWVYYLRPLARQTA